VLCVLVITPIFYVYTQARVYSMRVLSHVIYTWYLHAFSVHVRWCVCTYSYLYTCTLPDTHSCTHLHSLSLPPSLSLFPPSAPPLHTHKHTHIRTYTHTRTQVLNWGRRLHAAWRVRDKVVRWVRETLLSSALVVISICIYAQIYRLHAVRRFRAMSSRNPFELRIGSRICILWACKCTHAHYVNTHI